MHAPGACILHMHVHMHMHTIRAYAYRQHSGVVYLVKIRENSSRGENE